MQQKRILMSLVRVVFVVFDKERDMAVRMEFTYVDTSIGSHTSKEIYNEEDDSYFGLYDVLMAYMDFLHGVGYVFTRQDLAELLQMSGGR